ncbi:MAG: hypothetical protein Q7U82_14140 [Gammaproteobacteria bacterium]|nr:hypothetical protein [Gammaproteobacteria bacterium]
MKSLHFNGLLIFLLLGAGSGNVAYGQSTGPNGEWVVELSDEDVLPVATSDEITAFGCLRFVCTKSCSGSFVLHEGYQDFYLQEKSYENSFQCAVRESGKTILVDAANRIVYLPEDMPGLESTLQSLQSLLKDENSLSKINQQRSSIIDGINEQHRSRYIGDYESANTLGKIAAFEIEYHDKDPDNLIELLQGLKQRLEYDLYRTSYSAAETAEELQSFISAYETDDPDNLIPEARRTLEDLLVDQRRREEQASLAKLEGNIRWCKSQVEQSQATIERERRIVAVSGVENLALLRQAGEIIVTCTDLIQSDFGKYQAQGGAKSLENI